MTPEDDDLAGPRAEETSTPTLAPSTPKAPELLLKAEPNSTRSTTAASFDVLLDRLPGVAGLTREEVQTVVNALLHDLPEGWSTPRHATITAQAYAGRPADVHRLIEADLQVAEPTEIYELIRDRVLPTMRRLEREGASREQITDIAILVLDSIPPSPSRTELVRSAARHVLGEEDSDRRTTNYFATIVNLSNHVGASSAEETEAAALCEEVILGLRDRQQATSSSFAVGSFESKQVQIAAHNLAAAMLRIAQANGNRDTRPLVEARRLEVLSAAYDSFDRPPTGEELVAVAGRVGLAPFLYRGSDDDPPKIDAARAGAGLLVVQAVGAIGKAHDEESVHDAFVAAVSACCEYGWGEHKSRSSNRFYNAAVSLGRLGTSDSTALRRRNALLAIAVACGFDGDLTQAIVENDLLHIASTFAEGVVSSISLGRSAAADRLVGVLAGVTSAFGLTAAAAGPFRSDALRIVNVAGRLGVDAVRPGDDLTAEVTAAAMAACGDLVPPPLSPFSGFTEPWGLGWLATMVGHIFSNSLDPQQVDGVLGDIPAWIEALSRPGRLLADFGTEGWRGAPWESPLVYSGLISAEEWNEVQNRLRAPLASMSAALAAYIQAQG